MAQPKIAVGPESWRREALVEAVEAGGGVVVDIAEAEGLVWTSPETPDLIADFLEAAGSNSSSKGGGNLRWVQLPYAGIEPFLPYLSNDLIWTCGKGVYARPVAEHALGLLLAGFRGLNSYVPASTWLPPQGRNLLDSRITILGGGGIAEELLHLLAPWNCEVTVVRRHALPLDGAKAVAAEDLPAASAADAVNGCQRQAKAVTASELPAALASADAVILALALTDETRGIIDADALETMADHAWLVNVARGEHVVTDDLVAALQQGVIAGAALDVTDPEPLPDGHPLWEMENCVITPHIANTPEMGIILLAERVKQNVARFAKGEELLGPVNVELRY